MNERRPNISAAGVLGVGAALPEGRLAVGDVASAWGQAGGRGALAVCGADEDALTLAWSAGDAALRAAGISSRTVEGLWWGTARPPMAEGPSHAFLAAALGLGPSAGGLLASGSTHAGLDALIGAWDGVAAGACSTALVVASDALVPGLGTGTERTTGAGAVAFLLGAADGAPGRLVARATAVAPLLDRYRGDDQRGTVDPYDPRLYREKELVPSAVSAVRALGPLPEGLRWSLPDPDGRLGAAIAKALRAGEVASAGVQRQVGDTGSAAPFLGAVGALETPGPLCVVATAGGRSSAVVLDVERPVAGALDGAQALSGGGRGTHPVTYASVLRARGQLAAQAEPIPMGVPPGSAAFVRGNTELLTLEGRRCPTCGTIAVPPSIHPVCPACGTGGGELVAVARHGRVHTFVVNHTMPPPFVAPLPLCVVDLDDGSRVMLQGMPEDAGALAVGDLVALTLRRYAVERGVPVYGYKIQRVTGRDGRVQKEAETLGAGQVPDGRAALSGSGATT